MALLEIRNLSVAFPTRQGPVRVVEGVDLDVGEGEALGIVGESGSGKSITMLAVMGLLPGNASVTADRLTFAGKDLLSLSRRARRGIMGGELAMIFQEPTTRLNPCFTVGAQIVEMLGAHRPGDRRAHRATATNLLRQVGVADPERRMSAYPHQLSGGMSQRVMIAMAIACGPRLLIADEPSTALDVTIQAQILDLLTDLRRERGMALVLISHDMAVVAEVAERVLVMYAGQAMEVRPVTGLFERPAHPYTAALLKARPDESTDAVRLPTIPGTIPGLHERPSGCVFHPRCAFAGPKCSTDTPVLSGMGHQSKVKCWHPLQPVEAMA